MCVFLFHSWSSILCGWKISCTTVRCTKQQLVFVVRHAAAVVDLGSQKVQHLTAPVTKTWTHQRPVGTLKYTNHDKPLYDGFQSLNVICQFHSPLYGLFISFSMWHPFHSISHFYVFIFFSPISFHVIFPFLLFTGCFVYLVPCKNIHFRPLHGRGLVGHLLVLVHKEHQLLPTNQQIFWGEAICLVQLERT